MNQTAMKARVLILISLLAAGTTACGLDLANGHKAEPIPQEYSMNGVKLISPAITDGLDESTFTQEQYRIGSDARLLMRFEEFSKHVEQVKLNEGATVRVRIALVNASDTEAVVASIRLYPVTRNWMMQASWDRAHPFGAEGRWQSPGGDYDPAGGVAPVKLEKASQPSGGQVLEFDVTEWFKKYPKGRKSNFGLLLISDRPFIVYGDRSGYYGPQIFWSEDPSAVPVI